MVHSQQSDLNDKYNDGVILLATANPTDLPPLKSPPFHPFTEQVNQARKRLFISATIIVLTGLLLLIGIVLVVQIG